MDEQQMKQQAEKIVEKVKELVKDGGASKIALKRKGETLVNIPLGAGILGAIVGLSAAPFAILTTALVSFGLDCEVEITKQDGTVLNLNETPTGVKLEELKGIVIDKAKAFVEEFKDVAAQNGAFQKEEPYNSPWPEDHAQEKAAPEAEPEAPAEDDTPAE